MGKINILDKSIYNRIAAGEVVEKPASVVKEMVENSIDAGATNIIVEITNGGISKIRVTDNGCGMDKEDMPKAFMPHATSKICTIDDLDQIGTLGFRGEALSSIASVSKVTLISKTVSSNEGNKLVIEGGDIVGNEPYGCSDGTTIIMEDLFYNVPARAKFLRKPKQEETEITNYVSRLIMANPNIAIKYIADNKLIFQSTGSGLFDAIYCVYGKTIIDNLIELDVTKGDYHFSGYIGKPTFTKPNRTYQTLIINGRYVINQTISTAIYKAFENYMMKGNFPFYVINLDIPLNKVDVNVHPNKLDVKFEDNNKLFGLVYSIIGEILFNTFNVKSIENEKPKEDTPTIDFNALNIIQQNEGKSFNVNETNNPTDVIKEVSIEDNKTSFEKTFSRVAELLTPTSSNNDYTLRSNTLGYDLATKLTQTKVFETTEEAKQTNLNLVADNYKIIGVIFNTYIIVEQNNVVFFIDQHAAHERLLYDKFKENYDKTETSIQPLIVPYVLEVNYQESDFINSNIEAIRSLGFEIDTFGANCFKIDAVPLMLKNIDIKAFFDDILSNITNRLIINKADAIEDYLARSACRAAVKANDILSNLEISTLLNMLSKDNQVLLCPHGRPIVIKVTDKEIEKWFKRIV